MLLHPLRSLALIVALGLMVMTAGAAPPADDRDAIVNGVNLITVNGIPGRVIAWGEDAFAVVVGKRGATQSPIVSAGHLGKGRVVAWAHTFASSDNAVRADTGALIVNTTRWAANRPPDQKLRVGLISCDVDAYLLNHGFAVSQMTGGDSIAAQLSNVDVVLCSRADLSAREITEFTKFVENGGGLVVFACPWGWAQVRNSTVQAIPLNRVIERAGISMADGYVDTTSKEGFTVAGLPGPEHNAWDALKVLEDASTNDREAKDPRTKQAGMSLMSAVQAMPESNTSLWPKLRETLKKYETAMVPSHETPLRDTKALERLLITVQLADLARATPEETRAHPASASFPGAVPAEAPRVDRVLDINPKTPDWHSTGLYAAPGDVVTISIDPKDLANHKGWRVRIGCHTDELWALPRWERVPDIKGSWQIKEPTTKIASAFGGLIYIDTPKRDTGGAVKVTISHAVEAPLFTLGMTTNEQWQSSRRSLPGPWAELASDRVILTIPSSVARKIDDPTAVIQHWVKVLDADAELAGIPKQRPRPERFVADVQISNGYMHSGYPIMTHLDAATFMTDPAQFIDKGWGPYHELGHNHQQPEWTFEGTTEVTCNIFSMYVLDTVCGAKDACKQKVVSDEAVKLRQNYFKNGASFDEWKREPFLALQMYAQLQIAFGWDPFRKVFAEYRSLAKNERPTSEPDRRDQWMIRMSRATRHNLGPFFEKWGVPTSQSARDSVKDLPGWMPGEMN